MERGCQQNDSLADPGICPPTLPIESCSPPPDGQAFDEIAGAAEPGCVWFLKRNHLHYGTGTTVHPSIAAATAAAGTGGCPPGTPKSTCQPECFV